MFASREGSGTPRTGGAMDVFESEHAAAIAEMNKQIKAISDKTIGDYKKYEKESLKRIESQAGQLVQSFFRVK
ncbi:hypothetical protein LQW54_002120 [Pestalotiopsis sp. IQ-011]